MAESFETRPQPNFDAWLQRLVDMAIETERPGVRIINATEIDLPRPDINPGVLGNIVQAYLRGYKDREETSGV